MNTISLPNSAITEIQQKSKKLNLSPRDLIQNAIRYYEVDATKEREHLFQQEIAAWNKAADEDFVNFEKVL